PAAVRKKSFIINDVPERLAITADENMLASVLSSLLHTVVSHADNSCIRIGANVQGSNVMVNVKDSSNNYYSLAGELELVQQLAHKMSGYVSVSDRQEKSVTIAFSFPNLSTAA
ncbi:MAG: HAMP domain-containing histidine kinase, partial [Bacteroidia bacterium]|nr:HAMP domain-containing histidine kinase [Bacteroidia bacterium]